MSLLFASGKRPDANEVARLLSSADMAGTAASISHRSHTEEGWLELLATGLTFDLHGLAPAPAAPLPPASFRFGLTDDLGSGLEAVTLVPGEHLRTRRAMLPVVRAMMGLAASIAIPLEARALAWKPTGSWMEAQYFARLSMNWLAGGPFPALGLTALVHSDDGSVSSRGLEVFTGQELQIEAREGEEPAQTAKLAVRLIDYFVRSGRLDAEREIEAHSGERLLAEPSASGDTIWVWRSQ